MPRFFAVFFVSFRLPAAAGSIRPFAPRPRAPKDARTRKKARKGTPVPLRTCSAFPRQMVCSVRGGRVNCGGQSALRTYTLRNMVRNKHHLPPIHPIVFSFVKAGKGRAVIPPQTFPLSLTKYSTNVNFIKLFRGRFAKIFSRFFRPRTKKRLTQCKRFCRGAFIRLSLPARRAPPLRSARAEGRGSPRAALPS